MLKHRLIVGPIMIGLLIGLFWLDNRLDRIIIEGTWVQPLFLGRPDLPAGLIMLLAITVLIVVTTRELCTIFRAKGIQTSTVMVGVAGVLGSALIYILPSWLQSQTTIAIYATMLALVFVGTLFNHSWWQRRTQGAVQAAAVAMFAALYLGILPGFFLAIRRWHSAWVVAAIILIVKCCDIGAYFTGRALGRHKLVPWLSPGKTWEGLIGGVLLSTIVAVGLVACGNATDVIGAYESRGLAKIEVRPFRAFDLPLWYAAICGLTIGLVGQIGDLTASLMKRDAGIKDSGRSIPGFGGLIDVVDSPILVAPLAYWLLVWATYVADVE